MQKGTIARVMDKGYGFIKAEGVEKDLFFHANELQNDEFDSLKEGDPVEFEMTDSPKGPQATKVTKI
jgi:CspA family cold shock protein